MQGTGRAEKRGNIAISSASLLHNLFPIYFKLTFLYNGKNVKNQCHKTLVLLEDIKRGKIL